ncbi:pentatricopeptide repeat-containing protein At3g26630, chloroplastic [Amaranthus tricolor]|uniref:pentatricopeptide repeat-containing protein At3g26630, chloroplastic n=1 Tax=Amaranthus tricolor TaxID=29722 RepID=UPI00258FCC59|nr:pentatricopeptide repeat-containing protein At3g26630, chloroplastic [Amaranthus tricolor]
MAAYFTSSPAIFPLLQTCTNPNHLTQIHAKIIRSNLSSNNLLNTQLIRLYSSYGNLNYATSIFQQLQFPSTFTWNLIIRCHTINGSPSQSIILYNFMICTGVIPDKFTFPFVIKACAASSSIEKGKEIHGFAVKTGYYGKDMFVKNTLLDMYLKCRCLEFARKVFDEMNVRNVVSWTTMISGLIGFGEVDNARRLFDVMPQRNVVSWTVMINGYVSNGRPQEAFELFSEMQIEGVRPNEFTLVSLLKGCTELGSLTLGDWVHDYAIKNGFEMGVFLGTALLDMYSKCGSLEEAKKVFDIMEKRSLATWNSMISSLGVHGCGEEALALFGSMMEENVMPDAITFVGVLSACVQTRKVDEGLRYFKFMTEECGIIPVLEHYVCMFELWGLARKETETEWNGSRSFVQNRQTELFNERFYL